MTYRARVIVADPPWRYNDKLSMSDTRRSADSQYQTMSSYEIMDLPVSELSDDDSLLVLWCPQAMAQVGLDVMKAWGFEQKQQWYWIKTTKAVEPHFLAGNTPVQPEPLAFNLGHLTRSCTEMMFVGTKGAVTRHLANRSVRNVFYAPNKGHSIKPECVQDALDTMFPSCNKLEIFARRSREDWVCIGNECPETEGEDVRVSMMKMGASYQESLCFGTR